MDNKSIQITYHDFLIYRDSNNDVKDSEITKEFYKIIQNKLHFAITGKYYG